MTDTVVILTSGTSWTVPSDWNNAANTIEAIGGGAAGGATVGGAGADYAKVSNQSLSGSIAIAIGAAGTSGGNGGDTTFGSVLLAKGGGSASTDIGSTTYAGGTGNAAGGGGGAAGPSGAGGNAPGTAGGTGNNGTVPADTSGTYWGTAGSGGGGSKSSSLPSLVQQITSLGVSTGSNTATLPSATTAGHTLLLICWSGSTSSTFSVPSGFTLQQAIQTSGAGGITKYFTKIAEGTVIVITTSTSAGGRGFVIQEWDRAITLGTMTTAYVTGITTTIATGATDAPSGSAIPNMLVFWTGASSTAITWPDGWTESGPLPTSGFPYYGCTIGVGAATSSAVSPTLTGNNRGTAVVWANVWIEPA